MAAPLSVEMLLHAFAGSMSPDQGTREQAETVMHTVSPRSGPRKPSPRPAHPPHHLPGTSFLPHTTAAHVPVEPGVETSVVAAGRRGVGGHSPIGPCWRERRRGGVSFIPFSSALDTGPIPTHAAAGWLSPVCVARGLL